MPATKVATPAAPNLKPLASTMPDMPVQRIPLVKATAANLRGFGEIIEHQDARQVEPGTGDQGGTTEGMFAFQWHGDVLRARNEAVNDDYVLGWTCQPSQAREDRQTTAREELLLWRCNYHPDGGQLFFPLEPGPFVTTLALPGDDISPESFVAFYSEGGTGLYIHPGVWHEALCPVNDRFRFFGRQGKVHARVGSNFPKEFGCYLSVSLRAEDARETL